MHRLQRRTDLLVADRNLLGHVSEEDDRERAVQQ